MYTAFLSVLYHPKFQIKTIVFQDWCTIHVPQRHWQINCNHGNTNTFELRQQNSFRGQNTINVKIATSQTLWNNILYHYASYPQPILFRKQKTST